jgi:hypothetical protein
MNEAQASRDEGLRRVQSKNRQWLDDCLAKMPLLTGHMTGEEIRIRMTFSVGQPTHHNAWGSLIMSAVRKGLIEATGEYRSMKTKKSHARKTPVYKFTENANV